MPAGKGRAVVEADSDTTGQRSTAAPVMAQPTPVAQGAAVEALKCRERSRSPRGLLACQQTSIDNRLDEVLGCDVGGQALEAFAQSPATSSTREGSPDIARTRDSSPDIAVGESDLQAGSADTAVPAETGIVSRGEAPSAAPSAPAAAPTSTWDAHLDKPDFEKEPWLHPGLQVARRQALALCSPEVEAFIARCEFISLGSFCAMSRMIQLLGLKKYSYPFDWVRSSIEGVIHLLDNQFEDFLTYSTCRDEGALRVYAGARWGGSFWHHDLEHPKTLEDMSRRIDRLYGRAEVPADKPRVFVRNVNTTREVEAALRLKNALERCAQGDVYLLLIVDYQAHTGPIALAGDEGKNVIFFLMHESLLQDQGSAPTKTALDTKKLFQRYAEHYAAALAFAIRFWTGNPEAVAAATVAHSLQQVSSTLGQWDGGDPANALFRPQRFRGQRLAGSASSPPLLGLIDPTQSSFVWLDKLRMPEDPAQPFCTHGFGQHLRIQLPALAKLGHLLQITKTEAQGLTAVVYDVSSGTAVVVALAAVL